VLICWLTDVRRDGPRKNYNREFIRLSRCLFTLRSSSSISVLGIDTLESASVIGRFRCRWNGYRRVHCRGPSTTGRRQPWPAIACRRHCPYFLLSDLVGVAIGIFYTSPIDMNQYLDTIRRHLRTAQARWLQSVPHLRVLPVDIRTRLSAPSLPGSGVPPTLSSPGVAPFAPNHLPWELRDQLVHSCPSTAPAPPTPSPRFQSTASAGQAVLSPTATSAATVEAPDAKKQRATLQMPEYLREALQVQVQLPPLRHLSLSLSHKRTVYTLKGDARNLSGLDHGSMEGRSDQAHFTAAGCGVILRP
jgi:hypothetical protein